MQLFWQKEKDTFLYIICSDILLLKNEVSYFFKVTHILFLTTENVYNLTIYWWSHIEIPLSLELNHIGP